MSDALAGALRVSVPEATEASTRSRLERVTPFVVGGIVLVVAILTITPWPVGAFEDDAIYTVLAKALASGDGFRLINLPGAPHGTHFPPGYPLVLAFLWRLWPVFPDNVVLFKFVNAVFLSAAALGSYRFARTRLALAPALAGAAALLGALSVVVLLVTGVLLSEPMFMALLIPALLVAERSADSGSVRTAVLAGLLLGGAALVRTLGAVAVPAAMLVLFARRRVVPAIALGAAAAALLVPWQLWVGAWQHEVLPVFAGKYGAYGPWLAGGYRDGGLSFARAVFVRNLQGIDATYSFMFMPVSLVWARAVAFVGVMGVAAGGMVLLGRRAPVTVAFLTIYLMVIMLWPFDPDRFLLGIWPLLVFVALAAVQAAWTWKPTHRLARVARVGVLIMTTYLAAGYAAYNLRGFVERWWITASQQAAEHAKPVLEWIARHTRSEDVIATEHDVMVYLYTGRRAIPVSTFLPIQRLRPLAPAEEVATVREVLSSYHPRYFIAASRPSLGAASVLAAEQPPTLKRVSQTTNALVYERIAR